MSTSIERVKSTRSGNILNSVYKHRAVILFSSMKVNKCGLLKHKNDYNFKTTSNNIQNI